MVRWPYNIFIGLPLTIHSQDTGSASFRRIIAEATCGYTMVKLLPTA